MEAYLDNCVVSGMVRGDLPTAEMAVIPLLKAAVDQGRLRLVTSRESEREQDQATDPDVRAMLKQARPDFPLVAENEKLLGFNIQDNPGTFIASPMLTEYVDADLYEQLKRAGLMEADARHLMYAVHNKCDRFVTVDTDCRIALRATSSTTADSVNSRLGSPAFKCWPMLRVMRGSASASRASRRALRVSRTRCHSG